VATTNSGKVQYGPPDRGKGALTRASSGRLCQEPGCLTVLSTYNASTTCWVHSAPAYRHPLAKN
jgi:hypothetical protein